MFGAHHGVLRLGRNFPEENQNSIFSILNRSLDQSLQDIDPLRKGKFVGIFFMNLKFDFFFGFFISLRFSFDVFGSLGQGPAEE